MKKDNIYANKKSHIKPFEFNEKVVDVFDDMIHRSVPLYNEMIKRQTILAARSYKENSYIYDLGCSNGNSGLSFLSHMGNKNFKMIGIDNSPAMIEEYEKRLTNRPNSINIKLKCSDIQSVEMEIASVVVINLTLQFLPLKDRDNLFNKIYKSLIPGGILLFTEKVEHQDSDLSDLQQDLYYQYKKENGYSNLEISQKRDALENVLIPETIENHQKRLIKTGFVKTDIWLKWFNFTSFICIK